jgi:hypothetical protein
MRTDASIILILAALLTAAVVGAAYYLTEAGIPAETETQTETSWTTLKPASQASNNIPAGMSSDRTDTPIKCHDPEVGEYWTNAASCEGADLHNRISDAQVIPEIAVRDQYDDQKYEKPETASKYGSDQ